jgi:hypothetical protein
MFIVATHAQDPLTMQVSTMAKFYHLCNLHFLLCLCPMPLVAVYALRTNERLQTNKKWASKSIICPECAWQATQAVRQDQSTLLLLLLRDAVRVVRYIIWLFSKKLFLNFVHLHKCSNIYDDIQNKSLMNTVPFKSGKPAAGQDLSPVRLSVRRQASHTPNQPVLCYGQIIILLKQN